MALTRPMHTQPLCVPCLATQAHRILELSGATPETTAAALRTVMRYLADADYEVPSPIHTGEFFREVARATGVADPFAPAKARATELALRLLPELHRRVEAAERPFHAAVRVAIAGNVIDLATRDEVPESELWATLEDTLSCPLDEEAIDALAAAVAGAEHILYLADNAGEVVFDQPFLKLLPRDRTVVAVRGAPILNDAILEDAHAAGLPELVRVIDNGAGIPGTWLPACSPEFQAEYAAADLLISKGQGNFETLYGRTEVPTWFLFRVKCRGIEVRTDRPVGTNLVLRT
jgi:uncharacterized protein with ATP-grasp and redox domains